jgi:hypothetical protein
VKKQKKGSTIIIKTIDDDDEEEGVPVQGLPRMANWVMSSATQPASTKRIQK